MLFFYVGSVYNKVLEPALITSVIIACRRYWSTYWDIKSFTYIVV